MAERIVYVSSACVITFIIPSEKHSVKIVELGSVPYADIDPRLQRAAVKIRYHRDR